MNGKLLLTGPMLTYPFRIPMSTSSRIALVRADIKVSRQVLRYVTMIALTGSVRSGKAVARAAAESLKRVHLELGGKAPVVIFPDADLAAAATALRAAGYWNSGQECGAACRVLVHESVADEFAELLVKEVATMVANSVPYGLSASVWERTSSENPMRCCSAAIRAAGASPRTMASTTARWLRMCSSPASCSCRQKFQIRRARLTYWLRVASRNSLRAAA